MISCILQYSTIDFNFLEVNLKQLRKLDCEIIIPLCNKLYSGKDENKDLIKKSYEIAHNYKATIIPFGWGGDINNTRYYHNLSRKIGTEKSSFEWLLFLDTDEIITDEFNEWFDDVKDLNFNGYWFTCYWYFREPIYRSKTTESAGLLVKRKYCNWDLNGNERQQLFLKIPNFICGDFQQILSKTGKPLVHHYSWVRNKDQMLLKVKNWGHNNDKNWAQLVKEEFSKDFNGTDFIHNYNYDIVKPEFNFKQ
jgi:hypothetical protein